MNTPQNLFYTRSDEWLRREDDGTLTLGITDYAQSELGEIVYLELPEVGDSVAKDGSFGVAESVKAVGELHSPVAGQVVAANSAATENSALVNESPFDDGMDDSPEAVRRSRFFRIDERRRLRRLPRKRRLKSFVDE
jgi:glycine cleavage system H protein